MRKTLSFMFIVAAILMVMCTATAADSKIPADATYYNGHAYKVYDSGKTWAAARNYCMKLGGHLVTITSSREQVFVKNLLESHKKNSYWLGGLKSGGKWIWITKEPWSYTHWGSNQPDNARGAEDRLMMYRHTNPYNSSGYYGTWNDLKSDGTCGSESFFGTKNFGFICEWDSSKPPKKVSITGYKKVSKGNSIKLSATVTPSGAIQDVRWLSSDKSIATVDNNGVVKGKKTGTVTILALVKADETVTNSISIEVVEKAVKKITISCDSRRISTKDTLTLEATVTPTDAIQNVEWSSSNTKVAVISPDGKLTAVGKGTVTITAKAIDGSKKKATVKITVQEGLSFNERKKIVEKVKTMYSDYVEDFIDKEKTEIENLNEWFTNEQDRLTAKIGDVLEKAVAIDAQFPEGVKTEFLKILSTLIHSQIKESPTDYSTCKSVMELMKKVVNNITPAQRSFSFIYSGTKYVVNLTKFNSGLGASIQMGSIQREDEDRSYSIIICDVSNKAVKETLKSLSQFAQSNMKKACDDALKDLISASLSAVKVNEILNDFKAIEADTVFGSLPKGQSKAVSAIKVGIKALPLLKDTVKVYNAIVNCDLDSITDEKLTKKADDFSDKLDAFNNAVYDFMRAN